MSITLFSAPGVARELFADNTATLQYWLHRLQAGDTLTLTPGDYHLTRYQTTKGGSREKPIRIIALSPSSTRIFAQDNETFVIRHSHWQFIDLTLMGNNSTEHAFHISDDADDVLIQNCKLQNFDNHIKANGVSGRFPDNLVIRGCELFNDTPRSGNKPASPIDIIGGSGAIIRQNLIYDFGADLDGIISYGVFLKGASHQGRIEQNLIICSRSHTGIRTGISLGAGGTAPQFCADGRCESEHQGGLISNNIITNCSDAGIHLRKANHSQVVANTLLFTAGIDLDPGNGPARLYRNYIGGTLSHDKHAILEQAQNLITGSNQLGYNPKLLKWFDGSLASIPSWLQNSTLGLGHQQIELDFKAPLKLDLTPRDPRRLTPTSTLPLDAYYPELDFWGNPRGNTPWIGAIDYSNSSPLVRWKAPFRTE